MLTIADILEVKKIFESEQEQQEQILSSGGRVDLGHGFYIERINGKDRLAWSRTKEKCEHFYLWNDEKQKYICSKCRDEVLRIQIDLYN